MRHNHDPLVPQRRNKKTGETPDETEQRLNADLRALMNDKRYRKDDRDFRHYVQRQFRRVYDDPSGERPKGLRIGRPRTYASALEPFDRDRERTLRRESYLEASEPAKANEVIAGGGTPAAVDHQLGTLGMSSLNATDGRSIHSLSGGVGTTDDERRNGARKKRAVSNPSDADLSKLGPRANAGGVGNAETRRRHDELPGELRERAGEVADALGRSRLFILSSSLAGYDEAVRAHEHYLEGSGKPLIIDAEIVRDYGPVIGAENTVLGYLREWFVGERMDTTFGSPWLDLADGERIEIGDPTFDPHHGGHLVRWEATFDGTNDPLESEFHTDARMTISSGTLESLSQLVLERHGDRIDISGYVKLRVTDRYDFKKGHLLKSKVLEDHWHAKSFDISTTFWVRPISGWMDLSTSPPTASLSYDD